MFMASIGAASKTFNEMFNALHISKNNATELLESYQNILKNFKDQDEIKIATGLFADNSFKLNQKYLNNISNYLQATTERLNFASSPEEQRLYINKWISKKTNKKIQELLPADSVTSDTALVLANAVHFKSGWEIKFEQAKDELFYLTPNKTKKVNMMSLENLQLQYYHDNELNYSALRLDYLDLKFKMVILLPDAIDGLRNLENHLSKIRFSVLLENMDTFEVSVKLPRFKLEKSIDLKNVLVELGCSSMFSGDANFSEMYNRTEKPLFVSSVNHKAYIDVNEQGTEAAASTGIIMELYSSFHQVNFIANHPFIIAVISDKNDVIFMGRVQNP
ncbi:serpin B4-like isoform X2 [Daktulosphaira vitifoliae]|nr:serpin B4-like isoform X2 [Daktulosphaira vitifoliae]